MTKRNYFREGYLQAKSIHATEFLQALDLGDRAVNDDDKTDYLMGYNSYVSDQRTDTNVF